MAKKPATSTDGEHNDQMTASTGRWGQVCRSKRAVAARYEELEPNDIVEAIDYWLTAPYQVRRGCRITFIRRRDGRHESYRSDPSFKILMPLRKKISVAGQILLRTAIESAAEHPHWMINVRMVRRVVDAYPTILRALIDKIAVDLRWATDFGKAFSFDALLFDDLSVYGDDDPDPRQTAKDLQEGIDSVNDLVSCLQALPANHRPKRQPKRVKPGPKGLMPNDAARREKVIKEWRQAKSRGTQAKEFCRSWNQKHPADALDPRKLDRYQTWHRNRNRRESQ